jgi:hypothetical protein
MHTFTKGNFTVQHNSDFSGSATIVNTETRESIQVPCKFFLEWVAYKFVLPERVSKLEGAEWRELLTVRSTP